MTNEFDDDVVFREPPASAVGGTRASGKWTARLAPLVDRPGEWAMVATYPEAQRAYIQVRNLKRAVSVPPGQWEFTGRAVDGRGEVYARFLGPNAQ
jgi:hypothetical protein